MGWWKVGVSPSHWNNFWKVVTIQWSGRLFTHVKDFVSFVEFSMAHHTHAFDIHEYNIMGHILLQSFFLFTFEIWTRQSLHPSSHFKHWQFLHIIKKELSEMFKSLFQKSVLFHFSLASLYRKRIIMMVIINDSCYVGHNTQNNPANMLVLYH